MARLGVNGFVYFRRNESRSAAGPRPGITKFLTKASPKNPPPSLIPGVGDVPREIFAVTTPLDHQVSAEAIVEEPVRISDRLARAQTVKQMPAFR